MFKYYMDFWKNYTNFTSKATRSQYWYAYLWNFIIISLLISLILAGFLLDSSFNNNSEFPVLSIIVFFILALYIIATIIPNISITIRRLRDGGFHWAFIFFYFIPYIGGAILFIFTLLPSKTNESQNYSITISKNNNVDNSPNV